MFFLSSCCREFGTFCHTPFNTRTQTPQGKTFELINVSGQTISLFTLQSCTGPLTPCCQYGDSQTIPNNGRIQVPCGPGQMRTFIYNKSGMVSCTGGVGNIAVTISGFSDQKTAVYLY